MVADETLYRAAAAWWLVALDMVPHQVWQMGLEALATPETPFPEGVANPVLQPGWRQRYLFVPVDHCSSAQTAMFFCPYKLRLAVEPIIDPSHKFQRDLELACRDAHLWDTVLAMCRKHNRQ